MLTKSMCLVGVAIALPACASQDRRYETVSICNVLKNPNVYTNKKVSLRGSVYIGMENTNISDGKCPGQAIGLNVGNDVYEHSDIRDLHRKISQWKMHGFATVAGTFIVSDSPLTPYLLNVERVTNVTEDAK